MALTHSHSVVASSCAGQLVVRNAFGILSTNTSVGDEPAAFVDDPIGRNPRAIRERCPGGLSRQGFPVISSSVRWRSVPRSNRWTAYVTAISCRAIDWLMQRYYTQRDLLRLLLPSAPVLLRFVCHVGEGTDIVAPDADQATALQDGQTGFSSEDMCARTDGRFGVSTSLCLPRLVLWSPHVLFRVLANLGDFGAA